MCTVSWIYDKSGYELFFNRDEKRARLAATSPALISQDGVPYLAPTDGDFGGTWIAVNDHGITVCLLNGANLTGSPGDECNAKQSRGWLIPRLIASPSVSALRERFSSVDCFAFAAFTLAIFEPRRPAAFIEWDGRSSTFQFDDSPCGTLTSSSYNTVAVRASRQKEWREFLCDAPVDASRLAEFHSSHLPSRGPYSICMHRPDAETVSYSHIGVSSSAVEFSYSPGAPCLGLPEVSILISRS